jgi:signal transduction histidine kinase
MSGLCDQKTVLLRPVSVVHPIALSKTFLVRTDFKVRVTKSGLRLENDGDQIETSNKLRARLALPIFALAMIVSTGVIAYFTEAGVMTSRAWVVHTYEVRQNLDELQAALSEMRASGELYLLTNDTTELLHSRGQATRVRDLVATLQGLTGDNPAQQQRLDQLRPLTDRQVSQLEQLFDTYGGTVLGTSEMRKSLDEISGRRKQISSTILSMQIEEEHLLRARLETWDSLFKRNIVTLGAAFAIALVLLAYNYRLLLSEIARKDETEEMERQNAESYRALSARILELQDVERRKIARELHDSVGQYLTGIKLNLARLQAALSLSSSIDTRLLSETIDLADQAIGEVRTISHLLHPPLLDELGLDSAARWYVDGFSKRSGIEVRLRVGEINERLPKEIELALFRVLQESLTNVHRHANARSIDVEITRAAGNAVLVVQDDGKGIAQEVLTAFHAGLAGGIGLGGMRERLAELGGSLEVRSHGNGSLIRSTIPIAAGDAKHSEPLTAFGEPA